MSEDKFTAIVVGAGPAGSTAALVLAREGHDVLLIERGAAPGAKNMFGGRMYTHALNRIIPGFWEDAPVERPVVRETIMFLHGGRSVSLNCRDAGWGTAPFHSVTLLRAEFDAWLAAKAEEAGAMLACNIRVDDLLMQHNKVVGIRAGEDEMFSDVVIAADGVNSMLARKAGFADMFSPNQVATGAKLVIELPPAAINERFLVDGSDGAVQMFVGDCTRGMPGGGFLYTNKSSVSLGLVVNTYELGKSRYRMPELVEDFKANPHVAPLVEGGEVVEYSAHLIPEAGLGMMPRVCGDGFLVVGDAAGFVLNLGYVVRGMDFAIASGEAAAKAVLVAKNRNDLSVASLGIYRKYLEESFVLKDLRAFQKAPGFMENKRLFEAYPDLVTSMASELFSVSGGPPVPLYRKVFDHIRRSGISLADLASDAWKGVTRL